MPRYTLLLCALMLTLSTARAAEGPFFEFDGPYGFYGSSDVPKNASNLLAKVRQSKSGEIKCFAFTPEGDWIFLFGGNGYYTSNLGLPACKKLSELQKQRATFTCVAFAPLGGWTIFWEGNGSWTEGSVPPDAFKRIVEVGKAGGRYRSIAYGPHGAWVFCFDDTGLACGNCPKALTDVLEDAARHKLAVSCVAFSGEDWTCLTSNGWHTSNPSLAASQYIERTYKRGVQPKWLAIQPQLGPHDWAKWSQMIHAAYDGKLAGGYAFEVRDHGAIVAHDASGWARAPRERISPRVKWTLQTPMGVASVSKTITAVALLKLMDEKQGTASHFSVDDPFWEHMRALAPDASEDVKRVRIRDLLTQVSGIEKADDCKTLEDVRKLLAQPLAFKPGTHYEYQNNNFYIARLVLEQIGRVQYTPYVKEHVTAPMGITRMETHFIGSHPTCGYGKPDDDRPGYPFDWDVTSNAGAAGWYGSVDDLGRFLNGIREHRVLSEATTALFFKEGLGWDSSGRWWMKNGGWTWDEGSGAGSRAGELHSVIVHFPDDVDAVILCNCVPPISVEDMVVKLWTEARER